MQTRIEVQVGSVRYQCGQRVLYRLPPSSTTAYSRRTYTRRFSNREVVTLDQALRDRSLTRTRVCARRRVGFVIPTTGWELHRSANDRQRDIFKRVAESMQQASMGEARPDEAASIDNEASRVGLKTTSCHPRGIPALKSRRNNRYESHTRQRRSASGSWDHAEIDFFTKYCGSLVEHSAVPLSNTADVASDQEHRINSQRSLASPHQWCGR